MMPLQTLLVAYHLADLRAEAALDRRAREMELVNMARSGEPARRRLDVRRVLARGAVVLSGLADGAAHRLDPCLDHALGAHPAAGAASR
jgi:hypothetical protein